MPLLTLKLKKLSDDTNGIINLPCDNDGEVNADYMDTVWPGGYAWFDGRIQVILEIGSDDNARRLRFRWSDGDLTWMEYKLRYKVGDEIVVKSESYKLEYRFKVIATTVFAGDHEPSDE